MRCRLTPLLGLALWVLSPGPCLAESGPPAWPVRANISMPLGSTWGREKLEGFTWGFRPALLVYPTQTSRGIGAGPYAEYLIDARTHTMWSYGMLSTAPVLSFDALDLRVGGFVGVRGSGEGDDHARRLAVGALTELVLPAYLYDFRVGVRLDGTFDDRGVSATSLLVELDLIAVLGALAYASAGAR
ncbi:MAG: hypothetical protein IT377_02685 [Polyangiaceae bacterium]|nr:hypothetical protein [Polyangiaceae bacterium]